MNIAIYEEMPITKNRAVATIPTFCKVYSVQFEFKVTEFGSQQWHNIVHITTGGNNEDYGSRIASVFIKSHGDGNVEYVIISPVNGNKAYNNLLITPSINKWVMVKVTQVKAGDDYVYKVEVDGNEVDKVKNTKPMQFEKVTVYVSDPWIKAPPGHIRNLIIKGKFLMIIFGKL